MRFADQKDVPIQSIKFRCTVPGIGQPILTEFCLGAGPCGRHVDCLEVEFNKPFPKITQGSTGSELDEYEIKEFLYKMSDVHGRIEVLK